jgi:hypothetical protein
MSIFTGTCIGTSSASGPVFDYVTTLSSVDDLVASLVNLKNS